MLGCGDEPGWGVPNCAGFSWGRVNSRHSTSQPPHACAVEKINSAPGDTSSDLGRVYRIPKDSHDTLTFFFPFICGQAMNLVS